MAKVLILGGGFAGVEAAIFLRKEHHEVSLISDREYMFIFPTSIWVPVGIASFDDVCIPLAELSAVHGFTWHKDAVTKIDVENRQVICENKTYGDYDYLIIAMGAHKMSHKGIENTLSICGKPEESIKIKEVLDKLVEQRRGKIAMGFGGNAKDSSSVRGGPGFELLFNVHNMLKKKGIRNNFELTFFAPMEKPGAKMGEQALDMMDVFFNKLNIKKRIGTKISAFEEDGVVFEDGSKLESDFVMFIPAGKGHKVVEESGLPVSESGFVKINDYCQVEGYENIYAIGDTAELEGPAWRAKQGHVAEVMARNSAHNITVQERGEGQMHGYKEHLNILCVMDSGDGAAFVYRNDKRGWMIPMPFIGHWLKRGWGWYCRASKLNKFPRLPGM